MNAMARRAINPGEHFMLAGGIEATTFMVPANCRFISKAKRRSSMLKVRSMSASSCIVRALR